MLQDNSVVFNASPEHLLQNLKILERSSPHTITCIEIKEDDPVLPKADVSEKPLKKKPKIISSQYPHLQLLRHNVCELSCSGLFLPEHILNTTMTELSGLFKLINISPF